MLKKLFILVVGMAVILSIGCSKDPQRITMSDFMNSLPEDTDEFLYAAGIGTAGEETVNETQKYGLAREAAIADGYRKLTEKTKSVKLKGGITVEQKIATKDITMTQVEGIVKDATVKKEKSFEDGGVAVILEMPIAKIEQAIKEEE